ncbi:uncharacterized protein LOC110018861 [Phalaenopsis equestris]|uniref:uncharacterized protein LOC110018861 n=1 Tax=Phalaenopsis equestris TaxID=78828 RepID=UPI0009E56CFC|nr:uncharacterized protein LOC110018861 [Phalaenopsis equestris]
MSGLSLAVAPRSVPPSSTPPDTVKTQSVMGGVMGSLRVIELQLVAFIMVFSASGLVPLLDLVFPAFATIYAILLSRFVFRSSKHPSSEPSQVFHGSRMFQLYVVIGTTLGLFLPLAYVLGGFARGDDHAVRSATPHLFLLSCQILTENVISGLSLFSPPVRAIVPLLYTVRRIFVIVDWNQDVWFNKTVPAVASVKDLTWLWFGRGLATVNLVYFSVNLFGFLIPRFLPRAFERYFRERDEAQVKMGEKEPAGGDTAVEDKGEELKKDE